MTGVATEQRPLLFTGQQGEPIPWNGKLMHLQHLNDHNWEVLAAIQVQSFTCNFNNHAITIIAIVVALVVTQIDNTVVTLTY